MRNKKKPKNQQKNYLDHSSEEHRPDEHAVNSSRGRNLFPLFAVLTAAGATVGTLYLIVNLADAIGGAPVPVAPAADTSTAANSQTSSQVSGNAATRTLTAGGSALSASVTAPAALPLTNILGSHSASVVSVATPATTDLRAATEALGSAVIITGSHDSTVRIWSPNSGSDTYSSESLVHNSYVNDLAIVNGQGESPLRLATGSGSGELKLWDLEAGELTTTIADNSGRILSIAANADGSLIASGSGNGTLKVWPVEAIATQKSQTNLRGQALKSTGPAVSALAFHPTNPNLLVSGDRTGTLHLWDIARNQIMLTLAISPPTNSRPSDNISEVVSLSVSPDGRYVASASNSDVIQVWDIETGRLTQTLAGHGAAVTDVAFSPDGQVLASSSNDQTVKTWNWSEGRMYCTLSEQTGPIQSIAFSEGGGTLISGSYDGMVRGWDLSKDGNQTCIGR